jgi:hypothetical protein
MTETAVKVSLPEDVAQAYEKQSEKKGVALSYLLRTRLEGSVKHTDTKPLYITDAQRRALERILGDNLSSSQGLVMLVEKLATMSVGDVAVTLPVSLLSRLKDRCFGKSLKEVVGTEVKIALETFVGLR